MPIADRDATQPDPLDDFERRPLTFLGRGPDFSNPDFVVPNVHQFSAGIQRELPWRISLEATYAGSRSFDRELGFAAYNDPSAEFQAQCDVTLGGSRSFCDQLLPNPFFNVPGFEGTTRFTNQTLSRFELARPFPAFGCYIAGDMDFPNRAVCECAGKLKEGQACTYERECEPGHICIAGMPNNSCRKVCPVVSPALAAQICGPNAKCTPYNNSTQWGYCAPLL